ncbi:MAG: hypothetical protein ABR902_14700 [Candidatus Korobacteraceae bacterium]
MFSICRVLLGLALVVGAPGFLLAQFPVPTQTTKEDPEPAQIHELVSKYCRLDYEGARLDAQAWPKFEPIVWWKSNPNYTRIDVVARYSVDLPPEASKGKYVVSVHYRLLGTYDLTTGYVREPQVSNQDVDFLVSSENLEWRIADAENTSPHLSRAAMLNWLNRQITTAPDQAAKTRYEDALKQLQAQSGSPFAK